jgi:hypothetical protein
MRRGATTFWIRPLRDECAGRPRHLYAARYLQNLVAPGEHGCRSGLASPAGAAIDFVGVPAWAAGSWKAGRCEPVMRARLSVFVWHVQRCQSATADRTVDSEKGVTSSKSLYVIYHEWRTMRAPVVRLARDACWRRRQMGTGQWSGLLRRAGASSSIISISVSICVQADLSAARSHPVPGGRSAQRY